MTGMNKNWCGTEFDDERNRKKFRRALMKAATELQRNQRCSDAIVTPYWESTFIDWLIYGCTLIPAGCVCTHKDDEVLLFEVNAAGVQSEGIVLVAYFAIPAEEFTKKQLDECVPGTGEYYPYKEQVRVKIDGMSQTVGTCGPFENRDYIVKLRWSYDAYHDETRSEND